LAGAGSGKTRVITYRVAYLIEARGVPPESILAVTFTNKAADQMKDRVSALLSGNLSSRPHISTFHSFCASVLRREIPRLGYSRDFSIYDEDDQQRAIKAAIEELGVNEQVLLPRAALAQISYAKNRGLAPQDLPRSGVDRGSERIALLYERYEHKLRQANALDFDDLLLKTVECFHKAPELCEAYNHRFRYLLVDEYQDTNRIQYQLIRQLSLVHQNLCVVGDEDQSIYGWRGADIENILSFEKDYPSARLIRLEQNYRSTQLILDAASAVVRYNQGRKGKNLWSDRGPGERVGLFEAPNSEEEALFVASQIVQARASAAGVQNIAVLFRTNAQSRAFEEVLRAGGIDYRMVGGFIFYARAEIKDALAYARLATNPRDSAALLRIINTPRRGIGESTLGALEESARARNLSLWEALEQQLAEGRSRLAPRTIEALEGFSELMRALIRDRERLSMREFFQSLLEGSGYLAMLRADDSGESRNRIENLQELVNAAAEAEERGQRLAEFLDHAALFSDTDDYDERARVSLMTVHSAKGLDFSTVFLVGIEEGLFPHHLSVPDEAGIEEERRLFYVGMTRAKDRLVLTRARQRRAFGRQVSEGTPPSRFLREVPAELLERLSAAGAAKTRTTWSSAVNSVTGVERFLRERHPVSSRARNSGYRAYTRGSSHGGWKRGERVRHPAYGVGTILDREGVGPDTKLTISFPGYGQKKFVESKASLEKA
jgi:DNA helicase-2/ATP-dependent DNA helicase PcrA